MEASQESAEGVARPFLRFVDEAVNSGDQGVIEEVFAPDVDVELPIMPGSVQGREAVHQTLAVLRSAFPDFHVQIVETIVDGERVWALAIAWGTNHGPLLGQAATGRSACWDVAHRLRVRDGRIVEWRALYDRLSLLEQLGTASKPAQQ